MIVTYILVVAGMNSNRVCNRWMHFSSPFAELCVCVYHLLDSRTICGHATAQDSSNCATKALRRLMGFNGEQGQD